MVGGDPDRWTGPVGVSQHYSCSALQLLIPGEIKCKEGTRFISHWIKKKWGLLSICHHFPSAKIKKRGANEWLLTSQIVWVKAAWRVFTAKSCVYSQCTCALGNYRHSSRIQNWQQWLKCLCLLSWDHAWPPCCNKGHLQAQGIRSGGELEDSNEWTSQTWVTQSNILLIYELMLHKEGR